MNAIVPLNVTALRVNANDASLITVKFKGRVAYFENMPYYQSGVTNLQASTGDQVVQPLESQAGPLNQLGTGIHVQWELPDYFRRGVQPPTGGDVVFPQTPNRWLVIRYLSLYNSGSGQYQAVTPQCFIVESDYIQSGLSADKWGIVRPAVSVPLPANPAYQQKPYMYMGRVLDYADWNPSGESPSQFLPSYNGTDGQPLYLTSIGFVGPGFSSYYPECCSVFGFWDTFKDNSAVYGAINQNNPPIQFRVSYQVIGWINESETDPLANIVQTVTDQYNDYVQQCQQQNVPVTSTPTDYFIQIAQQNFSWNFNAEDITYTLNSDDTVKTLNCPTSTLCCGAVQEIVWNMLQNTGTTYFLKNPDNLQNPALWTDAVELAVGNTTVEALSALLKKDLGNENDDPNQLKNYEYLLDALQLGSLQELESHSDRIIHLDESLHTRAFTQLSGGNLWIIEEQQQDPNQPQNPDQEITLPLELAEQLNLLNQAQKNYDQARFALDQFRKQLFMDWIRYVKLYVPNQNDPNFTLSQIESFLGVNGGGELQTVINASQAAGILGYVQDPTTAQITGINGPDDGGATLAGAVYTQYLIVQQALTNYPTWQLQCVPAPPFWMPTDPVILMEGDRIEPVRRNGITGTANVRVSGEIISTLDLQYNSTNFSVSSSALSGVPTISSNTPMQSDVQALVAEAFFLTPMLAGVVAAALQAQGGANNPAAAGLTNFVTTLENAQGGLSPLEASTSAGLYAAVRESDYVAAANPQQTVAAPQQITFTFTNAASNGWAPDAVAWNAQQALPEFTSTRVDPFLPTYLIWQLSFDPLRQINAQHDSYTSSNITQYFSLNSDAVDYQYVMTGTTPVAFTKGNPVNYQSSVVLSQKPVFSLTAQIDSYEQNYPDDPADQTLDEVKQAYIQRNIMSQAMSGFSVEQILRAYIPQVAVEDLVKETRDTFTSSINKAATANPSDDWYDFSFNSVTPIATGLLAQNNFGPLRSGFMEIISLEIVDVFGQRMQLGTSPTNPDGSLQVAPCMNMAPVTGDTVNEYKIFLPPRILVPTRLWFRWLSATFTTSVPGITSDFVEMNSHPATSPVCGWILPNHLDNSLFFYDDTGSPIGSFGIEHGALTYRTRAGNLNNQGDSLQVDIGPKGSPTVNPNLANFMWYVAGQNAGFLQDLMTTILDAGIFINPANSAQNNSLALLVGNPLALTRAVLSIETSGDVLPLSQADTNQNDPYPQDIVNNRFVYADRMPYSSANLGGVQFPVRLGDLPNLGDGLVGYLIEGAGSSPYSTIYSPAAPASGANNVVQPTPTTIELTLNAAPIMLTMLVDPRVGVHATTGVLPVEELDIPTDQYSQAMSSLAMTFFTNPVLQERQGLVVPLPQEQGFAWSWINPGTGPQIQLQSNAANDNAIWDYTPQMLLEGWLQLGPAPAKPNDNNDNSGG